MDGGALVWGVAEVISDTQVTAYFDMMLKCVRVLNGIINIDTLKKYIQLHDRHSPIKGNQ